MSTDYEYKKGLKERFRFAWRQAFYRHLGMSPCWPTSQRFWRGVGERLKGEILHQHWILPRRHAWIHRLLDNHRAIDRWVMKL